jgi:hypothetical protein
MFSYVWCDFQDKMTYFVNHKASIGSKKVYDFVRQWRTFRSGHPQRRSLANILIEAKFVQDNAFLALLTFVAIRAHFD